MGRFIAAACGMILVCGFLGVGCKEEMVGAPCIPETDKGNFSTELAGDTWSIETRSVQCATRICLTKTAPNDTADLAACETDPSAATCWEDEVNGPVQTKFSFCSCRCRDKDGNSYQTNPDKYDYLCECPPNTKCQEVLGDIEGAPDKVSGSYCVPNCIATPCAMPKICTPSKDSEKPWEWKCKDL